MAISTPNQATAHYSSSITESRFGRNTNMMAVIAETPRLSQALPASLAEQPAREPEGDVGEDDAER